MADAVPALRTKGLSARFGGLVALNGVSLDVAENEVVSLIGPNGAGKSTLLNAVSRLIRTEGTISVFGRDATGAPAHRLPALGVGRTFQDPQLVDGESVLENVLAGAFETIGYTMLDQVVRRGRVRQREGAATARALDLLALAGLADVAARPCSELAYGQRKVVDVLRAVVAAPRLLLLDEPSSGLDAQDRRTIERLILHIRGTGVALLVVEHHMDIVRAVSDRVVALQTGSVLIDGRPESVMDSPEFRAAMVGAAA